jgi:hypothetical protein
LVLDRERKLRDEDILPVPNFAEPLDLFDLTELDELTIALDNLLAFLTPVAEPALRG